MTDHTHDFLAIIADDALTPHFPVDALDDIDWPVLVASISAGEQCGMEELYRIFSRGIRFYLCRHLGSQELDDKVHDTFVIVVQAIQRGELREPERLMGFVRTIVRRQVAAYIEEAVATRRDVSDSDCGSTLIDSTRNPEEKAIGREHINMMAEILRELSERDREILTRFYIDEQTQEQICEQMNLSDTQFRLLKSRAKARFGEMGRRKLKKKPVSEISLRTFRRLTHY